MTGVLCCCGMWFHHDDDTPQNFKRLHLNLRLVYQALCELLADNREILAQLRALSRKEDRMAATIQDILDGVNAESTVDDSIIALLQNIADQLKNAGVPQAQIDAIMTVVNANQAKIAAAVLANTPAAPAPTP